LIQTIQTKIYLGQIQHMCPFKCCRSQLYLPITSVSAHISKFKREYVWKCINSQWIVPQFLSLRPKNGEIYCICDNAYHKQEPCFPLFKLGQIVIWAKTYQPLDYNWPCTVIIYSDWQLWNYPLTEAGHLPTTDSYR